MSALRNVARRVLPAPMRRAANYLMHPRALRRALSMRGPFMTADNRKLAALQGLHMGEIGFLIGNGPSVRIEDLERLQGRVTFCCNRFYLAYDEMQFRPTYTLASDLQTISDFGQEIVARSAGTVFLVWKERPDIPGDFVWVRLKAGTGFSQNPMDHVMSGGGTLLTAIQIGFFMGIEHFVLYGVDHDYKFSLNEAAEDVWHSARGEGNHFIKNYRSGKPWCPPQTEIIERAFKVSDEFLRSRGGWIQNATRGGKLEVLERVDFDQMVGRLDDILSPIIIYQMGKVGSSTVYQSLSQLGLPVPVYHVHFLSEQGVASAERYFRSLKVPKMPEHIERSRRLSKRIATDGNEPWKIITLVREPIGRDISDFFENVDSYWPHLLDEEQALKRDDAIEFLRGRFLHYDEESNYTCTWFDRELGPVFGVDVYETPFDHERGYTIIRGQRAEVLILRLEDLSRSFGAAMSDFLGLDPGLKVHNANVGQEKKHAEAYAYVRNKIAIPRAVCERIYATRYARHFYPESMRNDLIRRWSGEQGAVALPGRAD